jgi:hypothetical protein
MTNHLQTEIAKQSFQKTVWTVFRGEKAVMMMRKQPFCNAIRQVSESKTSCFASLFGTNSIAVWC